MASGLELSANIVSSLSLSSSSLLPKSASIALPGNKTVDAGTSSLVTPAERRNLFSPVCV